MTKKKKNYTTIAALAVILAVVLYLLFSGLRIVKLSAEKNDVAEKNQSLLREKENLTTELESIHSKEYIERLARRDLRLVKGNELLFVLPEFTSEEKVPAQDEEEKPKEDKAEEKKAESDKAETDS